MEAGASKMERQSEVVGNGRGGGRKWCIGVIILLVVVMVVGVSLAMTLLKPKRPSTNVDSLEVEGMSASVDLGRMRVLLNLTLHLSLSLLNRNRVGYFTYAPSAALLNYRGKLVGEAPIPAGHISPRQTVPMNLTLTLMADRFLSQPQLLSDVMSDALPLLTSIKLSGKVKLFHLFTFHLRTCSFCNLTISVSARNITRQDCRYSIKL